MNRRTSLKNITFLGILGISSFSIYKWTDRSHPRISIEELDGYKTLIAELAETIIPRTHSPGAKDAKVEDFILLIVKDCDNKKDQRNFLNGLADLEAYTQETYHCDFIDCSNQHKIDVLNRFKNLNRSSFGIVGKIKNKFLGESFFSRLHGLTVEGFCTSQLGATQVLAYDPIPGAYEGCISLHPDQKTWAT